MNYYLCPLPQYESIVRRGSEIYDEKCERRINMEFNILFLLTSIMTARFLEKRKMRAASVLYSTMFIIMFIILLFNNASLSLNMGEEANLTVTQYSPADATDMTVKEWRTSNSDVARVDEDGKVYAYGSGTAIITAITPDGVDASCTVTVNYKDVPVKSVSIGVDHIGESCLLEDIEVTIEPANAKDDTYKVENEKLYTTGGVEVTTAITVN